MSGGDVPETRSHAPLLSHATQTHSRAFTHLLSQPHEELKIEEKSERGWKERNVGERGGIRLEEKHDVDNTKDGLLSSAVNVASLATLAPVSLRLPLQTAQKAPQNPDGPAHLPS